MSFACPLCNKRCKNEKILEMHIEMWHPEAANTSGSSPHLAFQTSAPAYAPPPLAFGAVVAPTGVPQGAAAIESQYSQLDNSLNWDNAMPQGAAAIASRYLQSDASLNRETAMRQDAAASQPPFKPNPSMDRDKGVVAIESWSSQANAGPNRDKAVLDAALAIENRNIAVPPSWTAAVERRKSQANVSLNWDKIIDDTIKLADGVLHEDGRFECPCGTLSISEVTTAMEEFIAYDIDGDGFISQVDFHKAMSRKAFRAAELDEMYGSLDIQGKGWVNFHMFAEMRVRKKRLHTPGPVGASRPLSEVTYGSASDPSSKDAIAYAADKLMIDDVDDAPSQTADQETTAQAPGNNPQAAEIAASFANMAAEIAEFNTKARAAAASAPRRAPLVNITGELKQHHLKSMDGDRDEHISRPPEPALKAAHSENTRRELSPKPAGNEARRSRSRHVEESYAKSLTRIAEDRYDPEEMRRSRSRGRKANVRMAKSQERRKKGRRASSSSSSRKPARRRPSPQPVKRRSIFDQEKDAQGPALPDINSAVTNKQVIQVTSVVSSVLMGKGGDMIRQIQANSACKINMSYTKGSLYAHVHLIGDKMARERAIVVMQQVLLANNLTLDSDAMWKHPR